MGIESKFKGMVYTVGVILTAVPTPQGYQPEQGFDFMTTHNERKARAAAFYVSPHFAGTIVKSSAIVEENGDVHMMPESLHWMSVWSCCQQSIRA